MQGMKMQFQVTGVAAGSFTNDDKKQQDYCSVHVLQPLDGDKAVGFSANKLSADSAVFDVLKGCNFPVNVIADVSMKPVSGAQGFRMRVHAVTIAGVKAAA